MGYFENYSKKRMAVSKMVQPTRENRTQSMPRSQCFANAMAIISMLIHAMLAIIEMPIAQITKVNIRLPVFVPRLPRDSQGH